MSLVPETPDRNPGRAGLIARSLLFHACFHLNTTIYVFACLPFLLLPRLWLWKAVHSWIAVNFWLLRTICGTTCEIRGRQHVSQGALLVAAKHQSTWETMALIPLFADPAYVLKRELMWVPLFGWYCAKAELIPVTRGARSAALQAISERAKREIARGRQIIMFPEGTRRAPGAEPSYKYGVVHLYGELAAACLPVALNSGLYWPRRSPLIRPGTIVMEILPAIPPGLSETEFARRLQADIETAGSRLLAEGKAALARQGVSVG